MSYASQHILSVTQFNIERIDDLFRTADLLEPIVRREKTTRILEGAVLGNLFFEPSTRTRVSFAAAFCRLGGSSCDTTGFKFSSMAKGESIYDTSRTMSGYVDALVIRHPETGSVAKFAEATNIPVVNGGDGVGEHPTQALLDLYTIKKEFTRLGKSLNGMHIAMVGDLRNGRTVHSLTKLISVYQNIQFTFIALAGMEIPSEILDVVATMGHQIKVTDDLQNNIRDIDVLYTTRVQKERFEEDRLPNYSEQFLINSTLVNSRCPSNTVIMHPLPRDSRVGSNDLSDDLNRDERLAIFRQTDNGLQIRMALFAQVMGVENLIESSMLPVKWSTPSKIGVEDASFYKR